MKDLEDTVGLVTSHGSKPFKDNMPKNDSIQVARLKAAGAIVIGKTNAPEFGYTATKNMLFGPTRNPWKLERTPGGSWSDTSAAIAAGVVPISTGYDGGGLVRIPSCYTGCYGLKPTSAGFQTTRPLDAKWNDTWCWADRAYRARRALFMDAVVGTIRRIPTRCRIQEFPTARSSRGCRKNCASRFILTSDSIVQTDVAREIAKAAAVFKDLGHERDDDRRSGA